MSKCLIVGNIMHWLNYVFAETEDPHVNSQNETPHPYLQCSSSRLGKFSNSVLFPFAMYKHGFRGGGSGPHPLENYKNKVH